MGYFIMQRTDTTNDSIKEILYDDFSCEEKQKIVDIFYWLIQEDKKQNPELYLINKVQSND